MEQIGHPPAGDHAVESAAGGPGDDGFAEGPTGAGATGVREDRREREEGGVVRARGPRSAGNRGDNRLRPTLWFRYVLPVRR